MTIIQIFSNFFKKKQIFSFLFIGNKIKSLSISPIIFLLFLAFLSILFFSSSNLISIKKKENENNFQEIAKNNEFSNLSSFLISKINSPYKEITYVIKNNDSIEKILKNFKIRSEDIKNISHRLKQRKLNNIYSGRKLSLILKKLEDNSHTLINLTYPINNTTSIEVRKIDNNFTIKENILQLYKKEVVVRNIITNNLYSSATDVGVEANIIIEFARIFGFEVDFQRDIRKGDWFEILYEKFER